MVIRIVCAVLLFAALVLFASSSAAAPRHPEEPARPVATVEVPVPVASPSVEERCTRLLWQWIEPYWDLGDTATPAGLEARYEACLRPWYSGAWYTG